MNVGMSLLEAPVAGSATTSASKAIASVLIVSSLGTACDGSVRLTSAMIDLRSDTQTKPSQAMRTAMAEAEVGDEQEREDPTVLELERRAAALLGHEEAVYLPTATMGNQIAIAVVGERGTELVVEENAHIMISELGGAAYH